MENTQKPRRILYEDPELIVKQALQTLGLSEKWLAKLMNIPASELSPRLNIKVLKGCEWYWLCNALYIPSDSISFGYFPMHHKASVRWAIRDGYFHLPKTWGFWKLRFEIWKDVLRDLRFQSTYYGFRLRWKARYQDSKKWIRTRMSREHREYNPVQQAWEQFHEGKIERNFFRPGLKFWLKTEKVSSEQITS